MSPPTTAAPRPHVCHYVDPDGTTAGTCHLCAPHGGRCPTCDGPADAADGTVGVTGDAEAP